MGLLLDANYNPDDFQLEVVSGDAASILASFSCGNPAIDYYFTKKINSDSNVCYIYRDLRSNAIVGAAAVCCSGIIIEQGSMLELLPSIKIDDFAVSVEYQDTYYPNTDPSESFYLSDAFLCALIAHLRDVSTDFVGAGYIILYSVPGAEHFYRRNAFEDFDPLMSHEHTMYIDGCTPMMLQL